MMSSWKELHELERRFGDSFYVLDVNRFEANYRNFLRAFQRLYPRTAVAYSYKANYLPLLCARARALGGYAEVVSRMEYDLAIRVGVPPSGIIFNGPCKSDADIEHALLAGAIVNLDSPHELAVVAQLCAKRPEKEIPVGVRCTFALPGTERSRFGFDVETDLPAVLSSLAKVPACRVVGLHCHFCTPDKAAATYAVAADRMLETCRRYFGDGALRFLDMGGGFFSNMDDRLKKQFACPVPTVQDYAEAIASRVAARFPGDSGPELILEPGIALTADAMTFCTKVVDIKRMADRKLALVTGTMYDIKPTLSRRNLPVNVVGRRADRTGGERPEPFDVVGCTCMEGDVLYRGLEEDVAIGDYLVFENVGAYTLVLSPPLIRYRPPVLFLDPVSGAWAAARRREELADVFATYLFPESGVLESSSSSSS